MPRFENPIEQQFIGEAAITFGRAGHKLRVTLARLAHHDSQVEAGARKADAAVRTDLLGDAAEAFWGYVIHRELFGMNDHDRVVREYGVPADVRRAMGPKLRAREEKFEG